MELNAVENTCNGDLNIERSAREQTTELKRTTDVGSAQIGQYLHQSEISNSRKWR